jgi:hypothetical protein
MELFFQADNSLEVKQTQVENGFRFKIDPSLLFSKFSLRANIDRHRFSHAKKKLRKRVVWKINSTQRYALLIFPSNIQSRTLMMSIEINVVQI